MDRIDLQVHVPRVALGELRGGETGMTSAEARELIGRVRGITAQRFVRNPRRIRTNAEMNSRETEEAANLDREGDKFLAALTERHLSPRGYFRLLKTARTIADLEDAENISAPHLAEAFGYHLKTDQ